MKAIIALGALAVGGGAVFLLMKHPAADTSNPLPPPGKGICYTANDVWDAVAAVANDPKTTASDLRAAANVLQSETMCDETGKQAQAAGVVVLNTRAASLEVGMVLPPFIKPENFPIINVSRTVGCEACDNGE